MFRALESIDAAMGNGCPFLSNRSVWRRRVKGEKLLCASLTMPSETDSVKAFGQNGQKPGLAGPNVTADIKASHDCHIQLL